MENRSYAFMTGVFTLTLLAAAILISLWLNRDRIERVPYLVATTRSVSGLSPQAPIRFRGLDVGRVKSISFDQQVPGQILVELNINPDAPITQSTFATLGFQGVTGIAFIQLNDDGDKPVRLTSTREKMARIELRASIFDKMESHGSLILTQAEELTTRLNSFLTTENQRIIIAMFDQATKTAAKYESIPQQLEPVLAKLPALEDRTQKVLGSVLDLSKEAKTMAHNVNGLIGQIQAPDGALQHLTQAARSANHTLGVAQQVADEVETHALPRVSALTDDARGTVRNLNRAVTTFSEQPQSILFGTQSLLPGPGEPGFVAPAP